MSKGTDVEPRYNCPVCPGLSMQKLQITHRQDVFLTLDCCKRCGGVWFDQGEVQLSQQITSSKVRQRITKHTSYGQSYCQSCHVFMDRNQTKCAACGWHNQIACPVCAKTLQCERHTELTLDVCHSCKGVWFDQEELSALWGDSLSSIIKSSQQKTSAPSSSQPSYSDVNIVGETMVQTTVEGGLDVVTQGLMGDADLAQCIAGGTGRADVIANTSHIAGGVVESFAEVTSSALEAAGKLPEVATVMLEVTGEVAGCMVEGLAELISSISP
ncbi:MAG: zf-TFIIB domain-containing protein [Leptolyngbyaceae cyanobacterium]